MGRGAWSLGRALTLYSDLKVLGLG